MEKEKKELMKVGIENYAKEDMIKNPLLGVEAIGFLKACKIVMPEELDAIDELIANYTLLSLLNAFK